APLYPPVERPPSYSLASQDLFFYRGEKPVHCADIRQRLQALHAWRRFGTHLPRAARDCRIWPHKFAPHFPALPGTPVAVPRSNCLWRGCRLLLQRFRKLAGALALGLEQAHVLNCDHSLVGESLQQIFLCLRDRTGLSPTNDDDANWRTLAQHRHPKQSPPAHSPRKPLVII